MNAEATGLTVVPNYNGFAYIMSNFQHPGGHPLENYLGAIRQQVLDLINEKWATAGRPQSATWHREGRCPPSGSRVDGEAPPGIRPLAERFQRFGRGTWPRRPPPAQAAQARALLVLVRLHAPEDVVEHPHRLEDVRALVEHDALGALAHRRVGDLGPRGQALLGRGSRAPAWPRSPARAPPRRATGSAPALRRAARSPSRPRGRRGRSSRRPAGTAAPSAAGSAAVQRPPGSRSSARCPDAAPWRRSSSRSRSSTSSATARTTGRPCPHRRRRNPVGQVLLAERRHAQTAVGEVDALVGPEFRTAGAGFGDPDPQTTLRNLLDQAPDLAVVEEDALADSYVGEHLRQRTADRRRARCTRPSWSVTGGRARLARLRVSREQVARGAAAR